MFLCQLQDGRYLSSLGWASFSLAWKQGCFKNNSQTHCWVVENQQTLLTDFGRTCTIEFAYLSRTVRHIEWISSLSSQKPILVWPRPRVYFPAAKILERTWLLGEWSIIHRDLFSSLILNLICHREPLALSGQHIERENRFPCWQCRHLLARRFPPSWPYSADGWAVGARCG